MLDFLKSAANAARDFGDSVARTKSKLESARRAREELLAKRRHKEDVIRFLHNTVDTMAAYYVNNLRQALEPVIRGKDKMIGLPLAPAPHGNYIVGPLDYACGEAFIFNEQIKARLAQLVEEKFSWEDAGPPARERAPKLRTLETEIASLQKALAELEEQKRQIQNHFRD